MLPKDLYKRFHFPAFSKEDCENRMAWINNLNEDDKLMLLWTIWEFDIKPEKFK